MGVKMETKEKIKWFDKHTIIAVLFLSFCVIAIVSLSLQELISLLLLLVVCSVIIAFVT
jgi:hypothetical protein